MSLGLSERHGWVIILCGSNLSFDQRSDSADMCFESWPYQIRGHVDTNLLLALESFLSAKCESPEPGSPEGKVKAEVLPCVSGVLARDSHSSPRPRSTQGNAECPGTSSSERAREAGRAWEGDPIYLDEEHRALSGE